MNWDYEDHKKAVNLLQKLQKLYIKVGDKESADKLKIHINYHIKEISNIANSIQKMR